MKFTSGLMSEARGVLTGARLAFIVQQMYRMRAAVCFLSILLAATAMSSPVPDPPEYVEGEVLVTFKPSVNYSSARSALAGHVLAMTRYFSPLSDHRHRPTGLVRARGRTTAELIAELKKDPSVETAEPNYFRRVSVRLPDDPLFSQQWSLHNTGQLVINTTGTAGDDIKFAEAWSLARPSSSNIVVAVIDTGANYAHPDLLSNIWTNPGENPTNGLDNDHNGYTNDYYGWDFADGIPDPSDSGYHGTHVAGTIAAVGNNQLGVVGVDFQAQVMVLKASNDGNSLTDSAIIEAIQYATMMKGRGVDVVAINASFGGSGFDSVLQAAIQSAGDAGIIFCAAAGNNSADNDTTPVYPASYRLPNMIVVAATDQNDALASFSDYGATTVDLGAPGVNILSTEPTNMAATTAYVQQGSTHYNANPMTFSSTTGGFTATIYDCGLGNPGDFPPAVSNNIALMLRGTITFSNKVVNAMAAGAKAAIIYNNVSGNFLGTLLASNNWIPTMSLSQSDGLALEAALPATGTVAEFIDPSTAFLYLDGTSMATPHVAGAVAFAAMNFPDETVTQRVQRILANVDAVAGLQGKVITGGRLNLQRLVDTDGNGLPDWWEQLYFQQSTGTDPNADPDHDGASNLAEWLEGTNPTNASSCLRPTAVGFNGTNGFVVKWPSVSGKFYRLDRATNVLTGFNSIVRTNIAATAPTNTEIDTAVLPGNARLYRIGIEP